mmetsp:Transcript_18939/g.22669  ORF Transcript_18939/g.22669 Transcript_18939/m.22669 type:complete len:325 (+) Transcript_18939:79-1053(+)|eukprot:CAMPEP_0197847892 /NCGR_PEP_ID=MMETSP1438-20131217/7412_1 /TAXON_ID=1461541 /ORGANISM="Pterosperma sp., Strain CCMP1384" /LENGTH=324 /DNA_ID=CAMNT_0043459955 /DNA_START=76 /DNA_END=1050 /DNA_ORIENTATION=+
MNTTLAVKAPTVSRLHAAGERQSCASKATVRCVFAERSKSSAPSLLSSSIRARPALRASRSELTLSCSASSRQAEDVEVHAAESVVPEIETSHLDTFVGSTEEKFQLLEGRMFLALTALSSGFFLPVEEAAAKGGEYGILEGRTAALLHPAIFGVLFTASLYAAYTGWQWRSLRTSGTELTELKKQIPVGPDGTALPSPELEAKIATLTQTRKELSKTAKAARDSHQNVGNWLLGLGVTTSIGGATNTYLRVGKLFPGPHLFAGAGITCLWAIASAMVPAMQKGNETARNVHIAANVLNIALFAWQIPTGLEIVGKVFQFTSWP